MSVLYVDTSLSGPWIYSSEDGERPSPDRMPYLVRIAWIVDDGASDPLVERCHLIEVPAAVRMTPEASQETGIFDHTHLGIRTSLGGALGEFDDHLQAVSWIIGHNWRHQALVLDHAFFYRLGRAPRTWPNTGCAQDAARKLEIRAQRKSLEEHNLTPTKSVISGQFMKFETSAAKFANMDITPRSNPITDGYRRVWAVRAIWLKYLELNDAERP